MYINLPFKSHYKKHILLSFFQDHHNKHILFSFNTDTKNTSKDKHGLVLKCQWSWQHTIFEHKNKLAYWRILFKTQILLKSENFKEIFYELLKKIFLQKWSKMEKYLHFSKFLFST